MTYSKSILIAALFTAILFDACKKKTTDTPLTVDPCAGKTIIVQLTKTDQSKCSQDGQVKISASGSKGFTFQINSGAFQKDSIFTNLTAGSYTVTAKDADGCTKSGTITVGENTTKGPLFTNVASLIQTKCQASCHGTGQDGAPTNIFTTDCGIVSEAQLINVNAVSGTMGSLSGTDKNKITAWINAGAKYTD